MFELIFFVFIIYVLYKKYNQNSYIKLIGILQNQGFHGISVLQQNQDNYWLKANFHGEHYLFDVCKQNSMISDLAINTLIVYATKNHYHNVVLVPGNSAISDAARRTISKHNIEIWNENKINMLSSQKNEPITSSIVKTSQIHDTCKIDESNDPIQDGTKVNSLFGNLFSNKIEKL